MPRVPPRLLAGLLGLTAIRLLLAATLPVGDDEAYYWEWSRHLAAGYVDHPPAVAYLVWAAVRMLGQTPFAIHAVAVVLSLVTALALWTLAAEVTGRHDAAAWAVIFYSVIPVFMAGSLLTAPDAPLFLCWTMTLLWAWRAAHGTGLGPWLIAGVWLGLGLQSKYVAVVLLASLGLWLLLDPAGRRWLARREPAAGRQTYDVDLQAVCHALEPAQSVPLRRGRAVIREVDLVWCRGFTGHPVPRLRPFRWHPGFAGPQRRFSPGP